MFVFHSERVENALLPALGEVFLRVEVLGEKAVLMRDADQVQHVDNHVEVRYQYNLRNIRRELLIVVRDPCPKPGRCLAKRFRVELAQMEAQLHAFVELIRF